MDFSLDQLLQAIDKKKEEIKASMRATSEAYRNTVKQQSLERPLKMLQEPAPPQPRVPTLREYISSLEKEIGAPKNLIYGMLAAESGQWKGGKWPSSHRGGEGIAQQTPIFVAEMERRKMGGYDPKDSIPAIARLAKDLQFNYKTFKNWDKAVAAYNLGRAGVIKAGSIANTNDETRNYVGIVNNVLRTGKPPFERRTSKQFEQYLDTPVDKIMKGY